MTGLANRGKWWEASLEAICEVYRDQKVARIKKSHEAWKVTGAWQRGPVRVFPVEDGGVDFYGTVRLGGRAWPIFFEAKETREPRFPLKMVRPLQLEFLLEQQELGAITFVLVHHVVREDELGVVYMVDPLTIHKALNQSHVAATGRVINKGSLSLDELQREVIVPRWHQLPDFMAPLRRMIEEA